MYEAAQQGFDHALLRESECRFGSRGVLSQSFQLQYIVRYWKKMYRRLLTTVAPWDTLRGLERRTSIEYALRALGEAFIHHDGNVHIKPYHTVRKTTLEY